MEDSPKYYTPNISEFYVGFECEFKNNMQSNKWETKEACVDLVQIVIDNFEHEEYEGEFADTFRVKYLDREDIESLGFEFIKDQYSNSLKDTCQIYENKERNLILSHYLNSNKLSIITRDPHRNKIMVQTSVDPNLINFITIKNKSELKKVLNMLDID